MYMYMYIYIVYALCLTFASLSLIQLPDATLTIPLALIKNLRDSSREGFPGLFL